MTNKLAYAKGYLTIWPIATLAASLILVATTIIGAQFDHLDSVQTVCLAPAALLIALSLKVMLVGYFHKRLFTYPRRLELVIPMIGLAGAAALLFALPTLLAVAQPNQT